MNNRINERQQRLYDFLCINENEWYSPEYLCEVLGCYEYDKKAYDHCKAIRVDKKAINHNPKYEKLIVMKNRCFKIGSKEDVENEIKAHYIRLVNQAREINDMKKKYKLDGQVYVDIIDEKLKEKDTF